MLARKHDFPDNSGVLGQRYGNDRHAHNWCAPFLKRQTNGKVVRLLSSRFCFRADIARGAEYPILITKRSKHCKTKGSRKVYRLRTDGHDAR